MWRRTWLLFAQAVTVAVAALFVVQTLKPGWLTGRALAPTLLPGAPVATVIQATPPAAPDGAASGGSVPAAQTLALAARRAAPTVVSISATRVERNPHAQDPWFRFFFGEGGAEQRQQGLGSGVIVAPEGYLLTNHHVVDGAVEIEVRLADGREASARVVGSDAETDLALLKIDLAPLPVITLAPDRSVQVGDAVLAIGNPFNVGQTVTAGIVSALDRTQVANSPFQAFIQTDAAINPGNSGGALVDAQGHLVGINTAIFSRSGGSLGIGFAVPVDTARQVMAALLKGGKVERGWIGVDVRDLTPELADTLALPVRSGVLIAGVVHDGPAAKGGMRPGDVVVSVAGQPVASIGELLPAVAAVAPGTRTTLGVRRGGEDLKLDVTVGQRPPSRALR